MNQNPLSKYRHKFSRIESNPTEQPIIGFDSEDDGKGTPILFAFYGDFPKKTYVTKHWKKALDFIYSIEEPTIFVAHNLEYDTANLFKQDNYLMVDSMLYTSKLLKVVLYGTKHTMIDSHSFFSGSLEKLGDFVGIPKLDGDPFSRKYILRDAEIPYRFIKDFQSKLVNELKINMGVTIGQMAMQTYRRDFMSDKVQHTYNSPNTLKAYYGGRVEIFYKGAMHNVHVSDINSCYPTVMKIYPYPDTKTIEPSSIDTHEYGIGKFKVHVPDDTFLPVLPYKTKSKRLFFPVGTFTGWWTYAEMRIALENGASIIKEYQGEGTNLGCYPFAEFIDTFYNKRLESTTDFEKLFYKLWLNNLYGKWCQRMGGSLMCRDKLPDFKLKKMREDPDFKECKIGPFYNYKTPKKKPAETANFMWGVYVTSYARMYLYNGIKSIHNAGHTLLYCDTDSIMFHPKNDNFPLPISRKLGDWDLETFDLGVFRQAKGYLLCNKK
jgi:hypothetical protein